MKIAIDISQIVYGTGVSNYTKLLVENLLKADSKNTFVLFGSSLRAYSKLKEFTDSLQEHKNIEVILKRYPPTLLEFFWNRLHIFSVDKMIGEVDIFHSSDWTQPPITNPNIKKITTIHDMVPFLFANSTHPKIAAAHKRRLERVKKEIDLILADSQTTKEDVTKFLNIPEEKVKVVYLAPSPQFEQQPEEKINEVLTKHKIKKPYILSVATQEPRKNIQKLLDVFVEIHKTRPEFHLVLTGKYGWGPGLHYTENIVWTDYVTDEDLMCLYSGARVFAYPSLYEGFGLPILEAMACGTPVVTSNNSSMAEIAKDAAILVDPRSQTQLTRAIEMVIDLNMENYQKMVKASRLRAKAYTWEKTAQQTLTAYEELNRQIEEERGAQIEQTPIVTAETESAVAEEPEVQTTEEASDETKEDKEEDQPPKEIKES